MKWLKLSKIIENYKSIALNVFGNNKGDRESNLLNLPKQKLIEFMLKFCIFV